MIRATSLAISIQAVVFLAASAHAQQPAWNVSSLGREGENPVPSASIAGGPRLYAVTATCVSNENALLFIDSATTGLKDGQHAVTLSLGGRSATASAAMPNQSPVFGRSLVFSVPLGAEIFSAPEPDARLVLSSGKIQRDWGDGAADAIAQVAAACAAKRP